MRFRVRLDPDFAAPVLRRLPPPTKRRIREGLRALTRDPYGIEARLDVRELDLDRKEPRVFRLRVGDWRIAYAVRARDAFVVRIFHRSEGYGWLERFE